ncbi:GerAB/ArcD/ProY family transporter [Paenibacillus flagellatus]|uniref:Spore gernimation protein n=1 Tax=Paenibacillus flagellatus TaxID=2211139 RepID=A0A2V5JWM9_9BACL|nr:endospore germination permease [Paenibacillus flagellatus]PYI51209.1 spore gernimation protein [Paenibacillus flagellatus]
MKGYEARGMYPFELWITIASWALGVGILTLPRLLAHSCETSDGWISLVIGGTLAAFFSWISLTLTLRFPGATFYEYTSRIVTKPVACVLTLLMAVHFLTFPAYVTRVLSDISRLYLLYRTPMEVLTLAFILILAYAASGSRAGLIRLNVLFLPIVLFILVAALGLNGKDVETDNLLPAFVTPSGRIWEGVQTGAFSFISSDILLFYGTLLERKKGAARAVWIGMAIITILYILIYIVSVGVFSREATEQIMYPTIEMAKKVEFPGVLFERFELIFLTTWIMTIFNTCVMALDISVWSVRMIFPKWNKTLTTVSLSTLVYIATAIPANTPERDAFGQWIGYDGLVLAILLPTLLLVIAMLRRIPHQT